MTPSLFADYVAELKALLEKLHEHAEQFQVIDLHVELAMRSSLLVLELKKRKGLVDEIAYARTAERNAQVAPALAYDRVKAFLAMPDHIALTGSPLVALHPEYPHAVVRAEYRARGAAHKTSTKMILIGINNLDDATRYLELIGDPAAVVSSRPLVSSHLWEWK
jgi:hypothetical protein